MSVHSIPDRSGPSVAVSQADTPAGLRSLPLYIAALICSLCGLMAVHLTLEDPAFANVTIALTLIGFVVSYISRGAGQISRTLEIPVAILFTGICVISVLQDEVLFSPASVEGDRAKGVAVLLTWLVVLRAFTLVTDSRLLFCCVPTIALTGLMSTMNNDPQMMTTFVLFVASATFMVVHDNYLRTLLFGGSHTRTSKTKKPLGGQVQLTLLCTVGALIGAAILAIPLRTLGGIVMSNGGFVAQPRKAPDAKANPNVTVDLQQSNEIRVGSGPVKLNETVLMRVRANHGAYWRGSTLDKYSGNGWSKTLEADRVLAGDSESADPSDLSAGLGSSGQYAHFRVMELDLNRVAKGHKLRQSFRVEGGSIVRDVFAASEPRVVRANDTILKMDRAGTIQLNRPISNGSYEVDSMVADWTEESLRATSTAYPAEIKQLYLQIPADRGGSNEQMKQIATQATSNAKTAYDKVAAIEAYVGSQCKYNTETGAFPSDKDAALHFLTVAKEGYCDSFATAVVMLCRSIGIPARAASGFITGEFDQKANEFIVKDKDRHLWAEVYFEGVGWIPFDATKTAVDISPRNEKNRQGLLAGMLKLLFKRGWVPPVVALVVVVLLAYVFKVEVLDRRKPKVAIKVVKPELPAPNMAVVRAYEESTKLLAAKGAGRRVHETAEEYLLRVGPILKSTPSILAELNRLTGLFVAMRYSTAVATDSDVKAAQLAQGSIRAALKDVKSNLLVPDAAARGV